MIHFPCGEGDLNSRILKICIALTGVLLSLHFVTEPPMSCRYSSGNDLLERIRLRSDSDLHVLKDVPMRSEPMPHPSNFDKWFSGKQISVHWQVVETSDSLGSVWYVEFRDEAEAKKALENLRAKWDLAGPAGSRAIGPFVVLTRTDGIVDRFSDQVLSAIEGNFRKNDRDG